MDEIITVVDNDNTIIGSVPRSEMRRATMIHRASYILVFNNDNHLFVQKRTHTKDVYPGYYDIAAGGVVLADESYEDSARRELQEELGITAEIKFLFDHFHCDTQNKVWGRVFSCKHQGPFTLQKEEIESGQFMSIRQIFAMSQNVNFTPDGITILQTLYPM